MKGKKRGMGERTDPFDWSGGHPALDLVNTLDERPFDAPIETLTSYRALVRFAASAGLIEPSDARRLQRLSGPACARVTKRVRSLREHLFGILTAARAGQAMPQASMAAIAAAIRRAHAVRALVAPGSPGMAQACWASPAAPDVPLHACALAVERLLVDVDRRRIQKCGASDCEVYFIDTSKGRRRQWCSMKNCGNRAKQRRWRSRGD